MSLACIFHVCFLLGLSKEEEDLGNINFFSQENSLWQHTLKIVLDILLSIQIGYEKLQSR